MHHSVRGDPARSRRAASRRDGLPSSTSCTSTSAGEVLVPHRRRSCYCATSSTKAVACGVRKRIDLEDPPLDAAHGWCR